MRKLMIALLLIISSFTNPSQSHSHKDFTKISATTINIVNEALETTSKTHKYLRKYHGIKTANLPLISPINPKEFLYISSYYGIRMHPILKRFILHRGIDFVLPLNSKVLASAKGVVKQVSNSRGYGKMVKINHQNGIVTIYAHLNRIDVKKGQVIQAGQLIALSGNTGISTGPHLHYEIKIHNKSVNPLKLFSCKKNELLQTMSNYKKFTKWKKNQISFKVL